MGGQGAINSGPNVIYVHTMSYVIVLLKGDHLQCIIQSCSLHLKAGTLQLFV